VTDGVIAGVGEMVGDVRGVGVGCVWAEVPVIDAARNTRSRTGLKDISEIVYRKF
jgi:hypothetical protein